MVEFDFGKVENIIGFNKYIEEKLSEKQKIIDEQQDQISYWKHKVSSLLWILGQFDKAKVEKLLKEIDDE